MIQPTVDTKTIKTQAYIILRESKAEENSIEIIEELNKYKKGV